MEVDPAKPAREMGKIQGYPIVIDGKYFATPKIKKQQDEPSTGGGLVGKAARRTAEEEIRPGGRQSPSLSFTRKSRY